LFVTVFPLLEVGNICSDDREIITFGRANHMDWSTTGPIAQNETTVSTQIFRLVLDQFPLLNYISDFCYIDHPIRPGHLPDSMREINDSPCGALPDRAYDT
jgi:hypothetical protein